MNNSKMNLRHSALLAGLVTSMAMAASVPPFAEANSITAKDLRAHLEFIASDLLEGRDTPSRGLDLAAGYISSHLKRWGFKSVAPDGSFFQYFDLSRKSVDADTTKAIANGEPFAFGSGFFSSTSVGTAKGSLVFVDHGYRIPSKGIDPYAGLDVRGKWLVCREGRPDGIRPQDIFRGTFPDLETPVAAATKRGAVGVITVPNASTLGSWDGLVSNRTRAGRFRVEAPSGGNGPKPILEITASANMVKSLFKGAQVSGDQMLEAAANNAAKPSFELPATANLAVTVNTKGESQRTQNVVAVWEGSDPVLKNEYVAMGAHYDHVGMSTREGEDKIYNGADDDGSGTVSMLEFAEALATGTRPKRSFILVWHAGEEKGLWGSEYFVNNPMVPLDKIVAQLNIDMIGKSKKPGDTNPRNAVTAAKGEVYVIGSKMMSTELGKLSDSVNEKYLKLKFNFKYDDPADPERFFYRSDHYNYAKNGIPIIFYFTGVHEDYHGLNDEVDRIDFDQMEKIARTIFATAYEISNLPKRPVVDKKLDR